MGAVPRNQRLGRAVRKICVAGLSLSLLGLAAASAAADTASDPPDRVARINALSGSVGLWSAESQTWTAAELNLPLLAGNRLSTAAEGRASAQLGGAELRIAGSTQLTVLNLDDRQAQFQIDDGALNLRVDRIERGQRYEVDAPTLALVAEQAGEYRIDVDARREVTTVRLFSGAATVYGRDGSSQRLAARQAYRFTGENLRGGADTLLSTRDDFDQWCFDRDSRSQSDWAARYVSPDVIGADDLDTYGSWQQYSEYGAVWFPDDVAAGWAPYQQGHWLWIDPWGWTWVDDAPWGYAPFHYGRWAHIGHRWGWVPGPPGMHPVWAPAVVGFYSGDGWQLSIRSGPPVGWFPLAPHEVYCPPYPVSRGYFHAVNRSNTRVAGDAELSRIYEDYRRPGGESQTRYANRGVPGGISFASGERSEHDWPMPPPPREASPHAPKPPFDQSAHSSWQGTHEPVPIHAPRAPQAPRPVVRDDTDRPPVRGVPPAPAPADRGWSLSTRQTPSIETRGEQPRRQPPRAPEMQQPTRLPPPPQPDRRAAPQSQPRAQPQSQPQSQFQAATPPEHRPSPVHGTPAPIRNAPGDRRQPQAR